MVDADTKEWLTSVYSPNGSDVYAVGSLGSIIKSENSGNTWIEVANGYHSDSTKRVTPLWLEGVFFCKILPFEIGYAVGGGFKGESPIILKTDDGGDTWSDISYNYLDRESLLSVYFIDELTGWAVSNKGRIIWTPDGGNELQTGWIRKTTHDAPWESPMDY